MQLPDFYLRDEIWPFQAGQRIMEKITKKRGESKGFHFDALTQSIYDQKLGLYT